MTIDEPGSNSCPTCGAPIPEDAPPGFCPQCMLADGLKTPPEDSADQPGAQWGDYELIEELGRGGMGVVWRARQVSLDREVALKMILRGAFASESDRQRFDLEAQAAAGLNHPHIVPIYEVGVFAGQPYYSMKLVQGDSLAGRMKRATMTPREAARWIGSLASAVHHAHQRGILHRDLKPANILMEENKPMIADFGLAKRLEDSPELTIEGKIMGSPHYMSPEQARGTTADISTATDIYSLGAILYHLTTGQTPFAGDSTVAVLKQVAEAEPPRPRQVNPKIDRNLETICLKCLAKDPTRRYASAAALQDDLERWLRHEPVSARRAPVWERSVQAARRHPVVTASLTAIVVTTAIGVWAVWQQFQETQEALRIAEINRLAERSARAAVVPADQIIRYPQGIQAAALRPDTSQLAVAAGTNAFIQDVASGQRLQTLSGHEAFVRLVRWSGDGRQILTASTCQDLPVRHEEGLARFGDQTARLWDAKTGNPIVTIHSPFSEPISAIAINAPGDRFALGSVDGHFGVWGAENGSPRFMTQASTGQVWQVEFSKSGSHVLASPSGDHVWVQRTHPGNAAWARRAFSDPNLVRRFDLTAGTVVNFPADFKGFRKFGASAGLPASPKQSSRTRFALSPGGRLLATAALEGDFCALWNADTGAKVHPLSPVEAPLTSIDFSADGSLVAAGSEDQTAQIWETATGARRQVLQPHPREVIDVAFAPNPRWLMTVCADHRLRIWDIDEGICVAMLKGHQGKVVFADFYADGMRVISASADGTARTWRWGTFEQMTTAAPSHSGAIHSIEFSPDGTAVLTGSADGTAHLSNVSDGQLRFTIDPSADLGNLKEFVRGNGVGEMWAARFTRDGTRLVTARSDAHTLISRNPLSFMAPKRFPARQLSFLPGRIWDAGNGREFGAVPGDTVGFAGVDLSPDQQFALFRGVRFQRTLEARRALGLRSYGYSGGGYEIGQAILWDLEAGKRTAILDMGRAKMIVARFHPVDGRILTATESEVSVWSPTGDDPNTVPGARGTPWTRFSPDGDNLLGLNESGQAALWDADSLVQRTQVNVTGDVHFAWIAGADGSIGALNDRGVLHLFNEHDGDLIWSAEGTGWSRGVSVASPTGRWLATAVNDYEVDLWDLKSRRLAHTLERHVYPVTAIAFSHDEHHLATGDESGQTWIWNLKLLE